MVIKRYKEGNVSVIQRDVSGYAMLPSVVPWPHRVPRRCDLWRSRHRCAARVRLRRRSATQWDDEISDRGPH